MTKYQLSLLATVCLSFAGPAAAQSPEPTANPIVQLRSHPNVAVRVQAVAAVVALWAKGDAGALEALAQAAQSDPAAEVRIAALRGFSGGTGCGVFRGILDRALRDPTPEVVAIARAVGVTLRCDVEPAPTPSAFAKDRIAPETPATAPKGRLFWSQTAESLPQGTASFSAVDLGAWVFSYGLTDSVELSLLTAPPVGAFTFAPSVRVSGGSDGVRYALVLEAGVFAPFVDHNSNDVAWIAGGGAIATFGTEHFLNVGVYGFAAGAGHETAGVVLPTVGASFRLSDRVRFQLEAWVPVLPAATRPVQMAAIIYGVRIFGQRFFGDISFALPIAEGVGDFYKVAPIGFPLLSFGYRW
jgi:hypothetical protein